MSRTPRDSRDTLFTTDLRHGRCESAVDRAVRAGQRDEILSTEIDAGIATLARATARALDAACKAGNPWAVAALARELRMTLVQMRLDPTSRGIAERDTFAELLSDLATPTAATALRDQP